MTMKTRIKQLTATQKAFHKKWLLALRSPRKYPKSRRALRNSQGFCCLGVALDLCKVEWVSPEVNGGFNFTITGKKEYLKESEVLSRAGVQKLGLTRAEMSDLTRINDSADTFTPVRTYIRDLMKHREQHYRAGIR